MYFVLPGKVELFKLIFAPFSPSLCHHIIYTAHHGLLQCSPINRNRWCTVCPNTCQSWPALYFSHAHSCPQQHILTISLRLDLGLTFRPWVVMCVKPRIRGYRMHYVNETNVCTCVSQRVSTYWGRRSFQAGSCGSGCCRWGPTLPELATNQILWARCSNGSYCAHKHTQVQHILHTQIHQCKNAHHLSHLTFNQFSLR